MPESTTVLNVLSIVVTVLARSIQPDDRPSETEEFRLNARVVSNKNRCPIEDLVDRLDVFDNVSHFGALPEFSQWTMPRVVVTENGPTLVTPPNEDPRKVVNIVLEGRGSFWHSGHLCVPVKRDGDITLLWFTPQLGMPRVESWAPDSEGRLVRIPSPPPSYYFIVRTNESDDVTVLGTAAVERLNRGYKAAIRLTRPVLDIDDGVVSESSNVLVPSDEGRVASLPTGDSITVDVPPQAFRKSFPDGFEVSVVV